MPTCGISEPCAGLVRSQVGEGGSNSCGIVFKQTDGGIAAGAEKAAHRASLMVVIYSQALLYACVGLGYAQPLAYSAAAALSFKQRVVLGWLNAKTFLAASIRAKSVVLLAIIGAPARLLLTTALLTVALKPVRLILVCEELASRLYGLATTTPLHSVWNIRPSRSCPAVPSEKRKGLTLNPPEVLSVPGCNWRWSATAALAQAFRYFGHHAFPSHLVFSNTIRGKE